MFQQKKKIFRMIEFYECICEEKNAAFWKKIIDDLSKFFWMTHS